MAKRQFVGFSTASVNQNGWTLYDVELIKQDIMNEFMTRQGERPMLPTYGSIIWNLLFEPLTESLKDEVLSDAKRIIRKDPRVSWQSAIVTESQNGLRIDIDLHFVPFDTVSALSVIFDRRAAERK